MRPSFQGGSPIKEIADCDFAASDTYLQLSDNTYAVCFVCWFAVHALTRAGLACGTLY